MMFISGCGPFIFLEWYGRVRAHMFHLGEVAYVADLLLNTFFFGQLKA